MLVLVLSEGERPRGSKMLDVEMDCILLWIFCYSLMVDISIRLLFILQSCWSEVSQETVSFS